ncbi:MAG: GIY-YIG nuclease family protein [Desulfuromonadaceae bacterium]
MARQFLVYWQSDQIRNVLKEERLLKAASNQYSNVNPGDTIWICGYKEKYDFVIVGFIFVDEIIAQDEANSRFPTLKWTADYHACACTGKEVLTRGVSLEPIISELRFVSKRDRLDTKKHPGNQLQRMRELTPESSQMLIDLWGGTDHKAIEEYKTIQNDFDHFGDIGAEHNVSSRREQKWCPVPQEIIGKKGYVYILVNPAFPGFLKVGKTTKVPEARARELSCGSGVPAPYAVAWDELVTDCDYVEKMIHLQLAHTRSRKDREFFAVPLKTAISIVLNIVAPFSCEIDEPNISIVEPAPVDFRPEIANLYDAKFTKDELVLAWETAFPRANLKHVDRHLSFCRELRNRILLLDNNIVEKFGIDHFAFFKGEKCFFAIHPQSSKVTLAPLTLEIADVKDIELTEHVRDISSKKYKLGGLFRVDISDTNNTSKINAAFELAKQAYYSERDFETWNLRNTLKSPLEERVRRGEVKNNCDVYSRLLESMELGKPQLHKGLRTGVTAYIKYHGNGFERICLYEYDKEPQGTFSLVICAGDTCVQAKQLYKLFSAATAERLKQNGWSIEPNFHLAWQSKNILFAKGNKELSLSEYINFWRHDLCQGSIRQYNIEEFDLLKEKMKVAKVMNEGDINEFNEFFRTHKYQSAITCPGIVVWISYSKDRLSDVETLSTELREKTMEFIKILNNGS